MKRKLMEGKILEGKMWGDTPLDPETLKIAEANLDYVWTFNWKSKSDGGWKLEKEVPNYLMLYILASVDSGIRKDDFKKLNSLYGSPTRAVKTSPLTISINDSAVFGWEVEVESRAMGWGKLKLSDSITESPRKIKEFIEDKFSNGKLHEIRFKSFVI